MADGRKSRWDKRLAGVRVGGRTGWREKGLVGERAGGKKGLAKEWAGGINYRWDGLQCHIQDGIILQKIQKCHCTSTSHWSAIMGGKKHHVSIHDLRKTLERGESREQAMLISLITDQSAPIPTRPNSLLVTIH